MDCESIEASCTEALQRIASVKKLGQADEDFESKPMNFDLQMP